MWDTTPSRILVAVESADCDAALEVAATEARQRRCGVHLLHVNGTSWHEPSDRRAEVASGRSDLLQRLGSDVLHAAAARLERLLGAADLPVSTELAQGPVAATVVAESSRACLVVLQHGGVHPEGGTRTLSTVTGVAARAHAPVVTVPRGWRPDPESEGVVSVGVEDAAVSTEVVRVAREAAQRSGFRLRLVHAFESTTTDGTDPDGRTTSAARRHEMDLAHACAGMLAGVPEVLTDVVAVAAPPAEALLEQALTSTMLVVGRRHPRLATGSHLGPVARAVLAWAPVPVMVVDPAPGGTRAAGHGLAEVALP